MNKERKGGGMVMGARETDRRPRRENCSESPTRILGQTEETRSRRCNGLSLSLSLSLSLYLSVCLSLSLLSIVPSRSATRLATSAPAHARFSNFSLEPARQPGGAIPRLSRSLAADRKRAIFNPDDYRANRESNFVSYLFLSFSFVK